MANLYVHHKFGLILMDILSDEFRFLTKKYPEEFLLGQQGPDLFYFNIDFIIKKNNLASKIHDQFFVDFLNRNKELIKNEGLDSPITAYFTGVICHFILDSKIHPSVNSFVKKNYSHGDIEAELDRYFLLKDKKNPRTFKNYKLLIDHKNMYENILSIYKTYGVDKNDIKNSIKGYIKIKKFFHVETSLKENFLLGLLKILGLLDSYSGLILRKKALSLSKDTNEPLEKIFYQALEETPNLIKNIFENIFNNNKLKEDFYLNFEGVTWKN